MANGDTPTNYDDPLAPDPAAGGAKSRDPLVNTTLDGRFHIEEVLGSGGMSVVYKARQLRVNRHVAIKTIRLQLDSKPVYKERFQREIASLCALSHPNIVTVYDCIIGPDEQPYVVMDYLRGQTLEALIKSAGPLDVERFARISMQVCSAVDHAHKKGIIHRDLKPSNIVLLDDETDFVKVVDFGLAKISEDSRKLTQSGELWGSPPYMSPEQCMGESGDVRSDIYSIGAIMYEMVTAHDPFWEATSIFELIQRHVHSLPVPFYEANPNFNVPVSLQDVVFKALEKNPLDRYQSAQELQDAVVAACAGDSGNIIFHPSRTGRSSGSLEVPALTPADLDSGSDSGGNQQGSWFAGMLKAGMPTTGPGLEEPDAYNHATLNEPIPHAQHHSLLDDVVARKTGEYGGSDQQAPRSKWARGGDSGSITPELPGLQDISLFGPDQSSEPAQGRATSSQSIQTGSARQNVPPQAAPPDVRNLRDQGEPNSIRNMLVIAMLIVGVVCAVACAVFAIPGVSTLFHPDTKQAATSTDKNTSTSNVDNASDVDTKDGAASEKSSGEENLDDTESGAERPKTPAKNATSVRRKPTNAKPVRKPAPAKAQTGEKNKPAKPAAKPAKGNVWDALDGMRGKGQ